MELRSANLSFEANLQEKVPLLWDFGVALVSSAFSLCLGAGCLEVTMDLPVISVPWEFDLETHRVHRPYKLQYFARLLSIQRARGLKVHFLTANNKK